MFNAPRPITDRRDGDSDGGDNVATEEGSSSTDGDDDGEAFGNVGNGSKILDDWLLVDGFLLSDKFIEDNAVAPAVSSTDVCGEFNTDVRLPEMLLRIFN